MLRAWDSIGTSQDMCRKGDLMTRQVFLMREIITKALANSGFECRRSCCGASHKYCQGDVWEGNMELLAKNLALLLEKAPSTDFRIFDVDDFGMEIT